MDYHVAGSRNAHTGKVQMGRRKEGIIGWVVVLALIAIVTAVPPELWIGLLVLSGVATALYFAVKRNARTTKPPDDFGPTLEELTGKIARRARPVAPPPLPPRPQSNKVVAPIPTQRTTAVPSVPSDELVTHLLQGSFVAERVHSLPPAPDGYREPRWIPLTENVTVAGTLLTGGGFYFGRSSESEYAAEPSLIDPKLNVARQGDFTLSQTDYWPSYTRISASARRAYLSWLSTGRNHSECDIGFVFLYFYGLERRVIVDGSKKPELRSEWPGIANEVRRLLSIYGEGSGSFGRYAGGLLAWIELSLVKDRLYEAPIPDFPKTYELPSYLRLALGQTAVDRVPVPAALALAWTKMSPNIYLRTPATRCPTEFSALFAMRYHEAFGTGLVLPKNKTKLKVVYQPASFGLREASGLVKSFGDVSDVTVLTAPLKKLQDFVNQCTDELSSYSRALGKDADAATKLDGLVHLPAALWPQDARQAVDGLVQGMCGDRSTMTLDDLLNTLGGTGQPLTRDKATAVATSLEAFRIGLEPNVICGAKLPSGQSPIVLFKLPSDVTPRAESSSYQLAVLTLQLASAVARADGVFSDAEINHLRDEIAAWTHLAPHESMRLHAHLDWLKVTPISVSSLKVKFEPFPASTREAIASSMATLTQADGVVSPDEIKFLEKVYKALGVDAKRVYSDVHAADTTGSRKRETSNAGFALDHDRIATLQRDTDKVAALLADIFKGDPVEEVASKDPELSPEIESPEPAGSFLGLDEAHSALVRLLLSRPSWSRSELEDAASDLGLMLDGALERINEASFDANDLPLTEGDDPLEVSAEVAEMIET